MFWPSLLIGLFYPALLSLVDRPVSQNYFPVFAVLFTFFEVFDFCLSWIPLYTIIRFSLFTAILVRPDFVNDLHTRFKSFAIPNKMYIENAEQVAFQGCTFLVQQAGQYSSIFRDQFLGKVAVTISTARDFVTSTYSSSSSSSGGGKGSSAKKTESASLSAFNSTSSLNSPSVPVSVDESFQGNDDDHESSRESEKDD